MADNAKTIDYKAKLINITKVSINKELLNILICSSMCGDGVIGNFIRIKRMSKVLGLGTRFELFDNAIGKLGIVFNYPSFNAGRIKMVMSAFAESIRDRLAQ